MGGTEPLVSRCQAPRPRGIANGHRTMCLSPCEPFAGASGAGPGLGGMPLTSADGRDVACATQHLSRIGHVVVTVLVTHRSTRENSEAELGQWMPEPAARGPRCRAGGGSWTWSATSWRSGGEICAPRAPAFPMRGRCEARAPRTAFGPWAAWQGGAGGSYCIRCARPGRRPAPREAARQEVSIADTGTQAWRVALAKELFLSLQMKITIIEYDDEDYH